MNFQAGSGSNPGDNLNNMAVPDFDEVAEKDKAKEEFPKQFEEKWKWMEEKFRAMECIESYHGMDAKDLSLVPDLESLTGAASKWYNQLSRAKISTWRDLAQAFMRHGKIDGGENNRRPVPKKRESEVNNVNVYNKSITVNQPRKQESRMRQNTEKPQFTPIPMTFKELYQNLFNAHVIAPCYLSPLQPPYRKWYDTNAQCDYHAGISGHSIENCTAFKKVVEGLIKLGVVKFDDSPNTESPLPNHDDKRVNMLSEGTGEEVKTDIAEVKTPLKRVWKEMAKRGLVISDLEEGYEMGNYCEFHYKIGHEIQECEGFRASVQSMMDNKEMKFYEETEEERSICASESTTKISKINHPVVIISHPKNSEARVQVTPKIVIHKPLNFSYKDSKMVPWKYGCNVTISGKEVERSQERGSYTRNGKRYDTPAELPREMNLMVEQRKGKAVEVEPLVNEPIKEEEAKEFLKFLKYSEYIVVEQLHKQPTRISVLALLLSSEVHRSALMKVLNETYVAEDISVNKLDRLGNTLPGVLIDNGSALNVLPLSTLNRLPMDSSHMKPCQNIVRAFDGIERSFIGRIEIQLRIGPTTYEVDFLVMDIKPSYNCLLGRPWTHLPGAVPSMLHQKVKLISEGRFVTISAEEDLIAMVMGDTPYMETNDEAVECSFRPLEFVNATFIAEGNRIPIPKISKTTEMGLQLMVGREASPGKGLGKYLQGKIEAPMLKEKFDRFGLGYKPDMKQKRKEVEKRQEKRMARLSREEFKWEPLTFPHISKSFVSGGFIYPQRGVSRRENIEEMLENVHINAIETPERKTLLEICLYEPGSELNNWTAEEIPVVFKAYSA
ncbi:uncharacterized protein LOC128043004 [Gossypium raimondii]|uniref:uncharacterized protein LOC128043004 n=1 Tax=Gossypium raimondii TaxID=29730 RepID=UPI00227AA863|nr:uncharacterized protein LOC128043004 [Gossypium raimondii]